MHIDKGKGRWKCTSIPHEHVDYVESPNKYICGKEIEEIRERVNGKGEAKMTVLLNQ